MALTAPAQQEGRRGTGGTVCLGSQGWVRRRTGGGPAPAAVLRAGVLLLDEVDLLLHPLRSELHWPLGARQPLDFTRPAAQQPRGPDTDDRGLRWQIPLHLLVC